MPVFSATAPSHPQPARQDDVLPLHERLLFALCISAAALAYRGYYYPHENHGIELLPIMALLDGSLFQNDFAVQSFFGPGPRLYFQHAVAALVELTGAGLSSVMFALHFATHLSFFAGIIAICFYVMHCIADKPTGLAIYASSALLGILCILPLYSWASAILHISSVPSTFAMAFGVWALFFVLYKRWIWACVFVCATILLQILVGLLLWLALTPGILYAVRNRIAALSIIAAPVLFASATIVLPMRLVERETPPDFSFLEVFGLYRLPHHWVPSTWGITAWLSDFLFVVAGLLAGIFLLSYVNKSKEFVYLLLGMIFVVCFGVLLNYLFVEIYPVEFIGKLQFQRIMPFGHFAIFLLVVAALFVGLMKVDPPKELFPALAAIAPALPATAFALFGFSERSVLAVALIASGTVLAIVFSMNGSRLSALAKVALSMAAVLWTAFIFSPLTERLPDRLARMFEARYRLDASSMEGNRIANWIRENTDRDEVILYPPFWSRFLDTVQLRTERAAYFIHKSVPFNNYGVYQWSERAKELLNHELTPFMSDETRRELWSARSGQEVAEIARRNDICYVVSPHEGHADMPGTIVVSDSIDQEQWNVWELDHCD